MLNALQIDPSPLLGTWKLVSYTTTVEETQEAIQLFGGQAVGYLIYTPEGFMSVHIMAKQRPRSETTFQEKLEAGEHYAGYMGRYTNTDRIVIHYPEVCSIVSYLQTHQSREFSIEGNQLTLQYRHCLNEHTLIPSENKMARSIVIWERVS